VFEIRQNDTNPALVADLTYEDGSPATIPAGSTVNLILKNPDATATYLTAVCAFSGNTVTYNWQSSDTATAGDYVAEFQVTYPDGTVRLFPTTGYFPLVITPNLSGTDKARPTYVTTKNVLADTRERLDGRTRPGRNKLKSAVDSANETITLKYPTAGVAPGMVLSVGLESLYVWDTSGLTCTVERGAEDTVPAQHAEGDVVLVDPQFTDARILAAVNRTLAALPAMGVYPVKALDRTLAFGTEGYDMAPDVVDVLDVRWQDHWDSSRWTAMDSFEVQHNMPTAQFPSGVALFLPEQPYYRPLTTGTGSAIRVRYRATFTPLSSLFDDVLTITGLPGSALDLLALGAAIDLMSGRPIQRVFDNAQPDPRNAAEVKTGDVLNAPAALRQTFAQRVADEAAKLAREWPQRTPTRRLMDGGISVRPRLWWR
jgi:Rib/alpha/Esp surface antigen-like repeat protein